MGPDCLRYNEGLHGVHGKESLKGPFPIQHQKLRSITGSMFRNGALVALHREAKHQKAGGEERGLTSSQPYPLCTAALTRSPPALWQSRAGVLNPFTLKAPLIRLKTLLGKCQLLCFIYFLSAEK